MSRRLVGLVLLSVLGLSVIAPGLVDSSRAAAADCGAPATIWVVAYGTGSDGRARGQLQQYSSDGDLLSASSLPVSAPPLFDIAWSSDGRTLYGIGSDGELLTIAPLTGDVTSLAQPELPHGFYNALSVLPDGRLITANGSTLLAVDVAAGTVTTLPTQLPAGDSTSGDFLSLADGTVLAAVVREGVGSGMLAIDPLDASRTPVFLGHIPSAFGAAQSGGRVVLGTDVGSLVRLDAVPRGAGTGQLATTVISAPLAGRDGWRAGAFYGASSTDDAASCAAPRSAADDVATTTGRPVTIRPLDNDVTGDGGAAFDPGSLQLVDAAGTRRSTLVLDEGTFTVDDDGSVRFVPVGDFEGDVPSVAYVVTDTAGAVTGARIRVTVNPPALTMTMTAVPRTASVGDTLTFVFTVTNPRDDTATVTDFTDRLPAGAAVTWIGATRPTAQRRAVVTAAGRSLTLAPFDIASGASLTFSAQAKVGRGARVGTYSNQARALGPRGQVIVSDDPRVDGPTDETRFTIAAPPVAVADRAVGRPGHAVVLRPLANDDPAGGVFDRASLTLLDPVTRAAVSSVTTADGRWTVRADGTVLFAPTAGFSGRSAAMHYRIDTEAGTAVDATMVVVYPAPPAASTSPVPVTSPKADQGDENAAPGGPLVTDDAPRSGLANTGGPSDGLSVAALFAVLLGAVFLRSRRG